VYPKEAQYLAVADVMLRLCTKGEVGCLEAICTGKLPSQRTVYALIMTARMLLDWLQEQWILLC
jgi:hypothetical protein